MNKRRLNREVADLLDRCRELRHEDLYELDFFATKEDANQAIDNAEIVIREIEKLLQLCSNFNSFCPSMRWERCRENPCASVVEGRHVVFSNVLVCTLAFQIKA